VIIEGIEDSTKMSNKKKFEYKLDQLYNNTPIGADTPRHFNNVFTSSNAKHMLKTDRSKMTHSHSMII